MFITKRSGVACCTNYCLWDRAGSMCELGVINSQELILWGETLEEGLYIQLSLFRRVSSMHF